MTNTVIKVIQKQTVALLEQALTELVAEYSRVELGNLVQDEGGYFTVIATCTNSFVSTALSDLVVDIIANSTSDSINRSIVESLSNVDTNTMDLIIEDPYFKVALSKAGYSYVAIELEESVKLFNRKEQKEAL